MIKRAYLEITNACNLNCPFCTNDKGDVFLDINSIKKCLIQIKEFTDFVYLHVLGEPLLHPDINEIFDYADKLNLKIQLVTNGTLLDKHLDILKHTSLRKLSISIHSINNVKFNDDYFETINKIIDSSNIYLELRFYNKENLDNKITNYLNYLYDKYNVLNTNRFNSYKLKDNVYIAYSDLFEWPNINDKYISNTGYCHGAIDQIAILHNLDVTLCCLDPCGHNKIGNLNRDTLKDILNSQEYIDIVKNLNNRKISKELCTKCSYRLRFDGKNN